MNDMELSTEKPEITFEVWRKRQKKMNNSYKSFEEISKDAEKKLKKDYHYLTTLPMINVIIVRPFNLLEGGKDDEREHLLRDCLFYVQSEGKYQKLDTEKMIDELVDKLTEHISVENLVRDALYDTTPDRLKEMYERVVENKGSVKEKEGCYKLVIGGKRGQPMEFMLRD